MARLGKSKLYKLGLAVAIVASWGELTYTQPPVASLPHAQLAIAALAPTLASDEFGAQVAERGKVAAQPIPSLRGPIDFDQWRPAQDESQPQPQPQPPTMAEQLAVQSLPSLRGPIDFDQWRPAADESQARPPEPPAMAEQLAAQSLPSLRGPIDFDQWRPADDQARPPQPPAMAEQLAAQPLPSLRGPIDFNKWMQTANDSRGVVAAESSLLTEPWWTADQQRAVAPQAAASGWELEQLIWLAIEHSPLVQSVMIQPQIMQAQAAATNGQFDPNAFVESIFKDSSDPVGNTLTTGSAKRLNDQLWSNSSGIRAKNTRGGQTEFAQDFNFKDSNSDFFVPSNQADAKMVLRYTQPLMRGAGVTYNRSSFMIASLAADQSLLEASKQVQGHAFAITTTYWELVAARASYAQITRGLVALEDLHAQLVGRADIDTLKSQQLRAESAIYKQRAAQAKSLAHMLTAQANLRAAVAAPGLIDDVASELVPLTRPADWKSHVSREAELTSALNYHPEIQAIRVSLQAARAKLQVAENELRPTLNLVMEGYVRGLNGDYDAAKSFGDQFSSGRPSYSGGLTYLRPYRNTAAKAILRERRLELRRTLLELDHTLLAVGAGVEGAIAQLDASYSELESSVRSTLALKAELNYLTARWQDAFLDGTARNLLLDQLLNAQIQLIQAENTWARAQSDHMIAIARVRLATGELLPTQF